MDDLASRVGEIEILLRWNKVVVAVEDRVSRADGVRPLVMPSQRSTT